MPLVLVAFLLLVFIFGVMRFGAYSDQRKILPEIARASSELKTSSKNKIKVRVSGYVLQEPDIKDAKQKLTLKASSVKVGEKTLRIEEKLLITTNQYPRFEYGQKISVLGELLEPENFKDSDFDFKSYLAKDQIFTLMSYPSIETGDFSLSVSEQLKITLFSKIFKIKNLFETSISKNIAEPNASFINGILLGSRTQIPDDIKKQFSRTSTSHILAISGYNITIIAASISYLLLKFIRRQLVFWLSVGGLVVFTVMTGAQSSVIRASIMGVLVLLAQREGRLYEVKNAIVFAGAMMVLINPEVLRYDIGFQLSFLAALGLVMISPKLEEVFKKIPNPAGIKKTLVMTLSAQVLVLPLILFYFKSISVTSLPANVLILPLIPVTMLAGFISGIAGLIFAPIGQFLAYFAWILSSIILYLVKIFASPGWASISITIGTWFLVLLYAIIYFLFFGNIRKLFNILISWTKAKN